MHAAAHRIERTLLPFWGNESLGAVEDSIHRVLQNGFPVHDHTVQKRQRVLVFQRHDHLCDLGAELLRPRVHRGVNTSEDYQDGMQHEYEAELLQQQHANEK